jgi:laccase
LGCSPGRIIIIKKKLKKNYAESNLFRVINVAATQLLFFAIANHKFTIVGNDVSYLKLFTTSIIMLGSRQTMYVLISGD